VILSIGFIRGAYFWSQERCQPIYPFAFFETSFHLQVRESLGSKDTMIQTYLRSHMLMDSCGKKPAQGCSSCSVSPRFGLWGPGPVTWGWCCSPLHLGGLLFWYSRISLWSHPHGLPVVGTHLPPLILSISAEANSHTSCIWRLLYLSVVGAILPPLTSVMRHISPDIK